MHRSSPWPVLLLALLVSPPSIARDCTDELCIVDIGDNITSLKATWTDSHSVRDRTHYNVIWRGGGGHIQVEVPVGTNTHTLPHFKKATVYVVFVQPCTSPFIGSSTCGSWATREFVSCGTRALPCHGNNHTLPRPMKIVSDAGKCLDIHAPDQLKNGAKVQVWDCNDSDQQVWVELKNSTAVLSLAGKCLDVHAPDQHLDGAKVQVWDCNGSIQQQWSRRGSVMKSGAKKCLDVHAPDQENNGAKVQVWDCNQSRQQRWRMVAR